MRNLVKNLSGGALFLIVACALVGCSAEAKRGRYMKRAETYFQKGEYIKAEIEYRNAARLSKTVDPKLVARIATIFYEQGRIAESFSMLTNAVALNPNDLELRYKLGTVWVTFRNYTNAHAAAVAVLEKNPAHHDALLLLADAAQKPDEIAAARRKINEIKAKTGETWSAHAALAQLALHERQVDLAEKETQLAAKLDAKVPQVNVALAQIASLRKQPREVEKFLRIAVENSPPRSPRRLLLAQQKMQGTNISEAKILVDKQLKDAPDYVPAWVLRGQIAMAEKDFAECSRIAKTVLAWNPLSYDIRLLQARTLVMQKEPAKALAEFARLEGLASQDPQPKYEAAVAHLQNGAVDEAMKKLDEAIRLFPDYPAAIMLRAELQLRSGAADEAVAALVPFTTSHPNLVSAHIALATGYRLIGRPDNALLVYRRLIEKAPSVPQFHFMAGMILVQQKKFGEAKTFFQQALKLDPSFLSAAEQMINFDLEKRDVASARERVNEQLKLTTNAPGSLMLHARVCLVEKDLAGAESALTRVISAHPESATAYSLLASIYLSKGDPQKALTQLRAAIEKDPKNPAPLLLVGTLYERLKEHDKARKAYEGALKLNPNMPAALNNLAYLLCEHFNEVDQALPYATKARELAPEDWGTEDTLGWIHYRRGEYARALPLLRESAANLPKEPEAQYHLAMTLYSMDDEASARPAFAKVVELDKAFAETKGVQQRLAVLDTDVSASTVVSTLESVLKKDPADFMAALKLGQAYQRAGVNEKARTAFERAARINSETPKPLLLLSTLCADKLNDWPRAIEAARAARKLAPNDAAIAGYVGRIHYRVGDYPASLALLQEYTRSDKADAEAHYDLALASYGMDQLDEARGYLGRYIAAGRGNRVPDARDLITLIDFYSSGKGDGRKMEVIASGRIQQDQNDLPGLMTLGILAQKNGRYSDAAQKFERVLVASKSFSPAYRHLAIIYAENLGNDVKALEYGVKARQTFSNDSELNRALGKAAFRRADFRYAAQLLAEAARQPQVDGETLFFLGMAQFKQRQFKEARATLKEALAMKLDPKLAEESTATLKQIQD